MSIGQTIARIGSKPSAMEQELTPDELVRRYGDDVWRFVASKLNRREDAEDVTMEVFGIAFQSMQSLRKAESARLWLLVVARRKVMDNLRRNYRRSELPLESAHEQAAPTETSLRWEIKNLVDRLPEAHRDALILKYVNGLETIEVAKIMKKTEKATNSLLQRARQSLRELGLSELPELQGRVSR
ncbi:MAG: sigma-70 family RNA polymerase sigma factor [Fimbriimonadaceae bacterium]|nr:sigma-70 family RNA polymerase sigma factor [Fimbriimonadaceae bacterium]